jgi:hypothetical protein
MFMRGKGTTLVNTYRGSKETKFMDAIRWKLWTSQCGAEQFIFCTGRANYIRVHSFLERMRYHLIGSMRSCVHP